MKKLILITALTLVSLQAQLYAQSYIAKQMSKSKTELTFNANEGLVNIRDFVVLKEGGMILELSDLEDYESFRNLDSLLTNFKNDIAFYKDSLAANATGHVRIDYVINSEYSFKKIRFKKYNADGSIFMNQDGDIARLKFEQDTIRIIIQKSKPGIAAKGHTPCSVAYSIQATFVLGNYYDIDKVLAGKTLTGIVDTLCKESQTKQVRNKNYPPPMSIVYNPYYSGKGGLERYGWLINNEYDTYSAKHKSKFLSINPFIGAGLIMNTVAPMAELGIQYNKYLSWNHNNLDFFRISVAPYFLFTKDEQGNNITNGNWFVNADIGSTYEGNERSWLGKTASFGVGYLVVQKGGYFKNTTFKVFTDLQVIPRFTIAPEVLFTNNCKQIFPGITLKVF